MEYLQKLLKSKTIWVGIIQVLTGLSLYFTGEQNLHEVILGANGILMIIFRLISHDSVNDK